VECAINVSDDLWGSGVDLSSVQYRYLTGGGEMSSWTSVGMTGTIHGTVFSVIITLEEGTGNAVQFRAYDAAGNGPTTTEEFPISVDGTPPEILLMRPEVGERQERSAVTIVYELEDALTDVSPYSAQYRFGGTGEDSFSDWIDAPAVRTAGVWRVQLVLEFWEGPSNVFQLRATDLLGNEALSEVLHVHVNRLPVIVIKEPTFNAQVPTGTPVVLDATGTHDPDGDRLTYQWKIDDVIGVSGEGPVQEALLPLGEHRLTLTVEDEYGGTVTEIVVVQVVKAPPPPTEEDGPFIGTWTVIAIVVVAVVATIVMVLRNRGSR
jgi:hypothetical protein